MLDSIDIPDLPASQRARKEESLTGNIVATFQQVKALRKGKGQDIRQSWCRIEDCITEEFWQSTCRRMESKCFMFRCKRLKPLDMWNVMEES